MRKVGMEIPKRDPAMMRRLAGELGATETNTPSPTPKVTAMSIAMRANSKVAGNRSKISCMAGSRLTKDIPKLPCRAFRRKMRYWI